MDQMAASQIRLNNPLIWWAVAMLALVAVAAATSGMWWPSLAAMTATSGNGENGAAAATEGSADEKQHDDHAGEVTSLTLSEQGRANIGLRVEKVSLKPFERTMPLPAMIVERPGKTRLRIAAPLTGVVTAVHVIQGEAVTPGQTMFDVRLTHEELVQAQSDFLSTIEELAVLEKELARLEPLAEEKGIAVRKRLEHQYEQQKKLAVMRAQRQSLALHGMTEEQIESIEADRTLLKGLTVNAPQPTGGTSGDAPPLLLQQLTVTAGQHVAIGEPLGVLADHSLLYIEGRAFEQDAARLNEAIENDTEVTAVITSSDGGRERIEELKILYISDEVHAESRALHCYLRLENDLVRDTTTDDGHRFISWRFKPGQRLELLIPVERWTDRIVLPVEAVAQDAAESYVFIQNGSQYDRVPVRVQYRDQDWAVIAADGSVFPGDLVAVSGAYQMHLALKNASGGAVDPHAGHSH